MTGATTLKQLPTGDEAWPPKVVTPRRNRPNLPPSEVKGARMKFPSPAVVASLAVCFLFMSSATAQEKSVRPGINKPFESPDVKDFVQKFESESREIAARANDIVAACKLKPGMAVADVGAGTGLFTRKFAALVGDKGKVYAVDIAPAFLRHIEKTCAEKKLTNVESVLCDQFSTKLPKNCVDLVFICDTYHHFEYPQRTLQSIHDALRPGGQIIVIDFHRIKGKSNLWVLGHVRAGQEVFEKEITTAGFKVVGEEKILKDNYFVRFEKKAGRTLELFQSKLDKAMTPTKAVAAFGEPDRKKGSGLIIYEYDLEDSSMVRLGFPGPDKLLYARHIKKGGDVEDLPVK
jgi:predicted methyltransferase